MVLEKDGKYHLDSRVRREEVLHRVREKRNTLHTAKSRKANWIGHILSRNCLLKDVHDGKIEGMVKIAGRRRRRKQLLYKLNEEKVYWKFKEEALDRTLWRNSFGGGHGPVVRHYGMNEFLQARYGPGSSVGVATGYGLDGPGIESRWGARFFANVQTGPGANPASCTMGTGSFPGA
jgi:hypothetical protein